MVLELWFLFAFVMVVNVRHNLLLWLFYRWFNPNHLPSIYHLMNQQLLRIYEQIKIFKVNTLNHLNRFLPPRFHLNSHLLHPTFLIALSTLWRISLLQLSFCQVISEFPYLLLCLAKGVLHNLPMSLVFLFSEELNYSWPIDMLCCHFFFHSIKYLLECFFWNSWNSLWFSSNSC